MTGSLERIYEFARRADLELTAVSEEGFREEVMLDLEDTEGVDAAAVVRSRVAIGGTEALLLGLDARAESLAGPLASSLLKSFRHYADDPAPLLHGVFVGQKLADLESIRRGDEISIWTPTGNQSTEILGLIPSDPADQVNGGLVVVALRGVAQSLAGKPGQIDHLYLRFDDSLKPAARSRFEHSIESPEYTVGSPGLRARQAADDLAPIRSALLVTVAGTFVVSGFLLTNASRLTVLERARELGTMRVIGGRSRDMLVAGLVQPMVFGVVGSVLGAFVGDVLGRALVSRLPGLYVSAVGVQIRAVPDSRVRLLALVAGTLTALAASAPSIWRAVSPSGPIPANSSPSGSRRFVAAGFFLCAAGGYWGLVRARSSFTLSISVVSVMTGLIVGVMGLSRQLAEIQGWLSDRFGVSGRLAATSSRRAPQRIWATTMAIALSTALFVATAGTGDNFNRAIDRMVIPYTRMDLIAQSSPPDRPPVSLPLPDGLDEELSEIPGVESVVPSRFGYINLGEDRVYVAGLNRGSHHPLLELSRPRSKLEILAGRGIVATRELANSLGLLEGDRIKLPTTEGFRSIVVVEVLDAAFGIDGGTIGLSQELAQRWFGLHGASRFEVSVSEGRISSVRKAILSRVSSQPIPIHLFPGREQAEEVRASDGALLATFEALELISILGTGLVIFGSMSASIAQRTREFGVLRAIGASRRRLRRVVSTEAVAMGLAGGAMGIACGILIHGMAIAGSAAAAGFKIDYQFDTPAIGWALLVATLPALAGAFIPALKAARLNIVQAIAYE